MSEYLSVRQQPISAFKLAGTIVCTLCWLMMVSSARADGQHQNLTVMTQNVYLGADLSPIFLAPTNDDAIHAASTAWQDVQRSDIPARAAQIGDEIAAAQPALVALQEAAQWSGPNSSGILVQYDFVQSILNELAFKGMHYTAIRVINDLDQIVPIGPPPAGPYVHFVDRDAVLARTDLSKVSISNVQAANFVNLLTISTGFGPITIPRSWIEADVNIGGTSFRFLTTHLESFYPPIQEAQAGELLAGPANTSIPVVMAGDFNSNANGQPNLPDNTPTYADLLAAGFDDMWKGTSHKDGDTCCQDPTLTNYPSEFIERLDLVLGNDGVEDANERVIGDRNGERIATPNGRLWPSDHAGLVAVLKIP